MNWQTIWPLLWELAKLVVAAVVASPAVVYLSQRLIEHRLAKALEDHKSTLARDQATAIEVVKAQGAKDLEEHKSKLAKDQAAALEVLRAQSAKDLENHKGMLAREQAAALEVMRAQNVAELQAEKAKLDHAVSRWSQRYTHFHQRRVEALITMHDALVDMRMAIAPAFSIRMPGSGDSVRDEAARAGSLYNDAFKLFSHKRLFMDDELAAQHEKLFNNFHELISGFTNVREGREWENAADKWFLFTGGVLAVERSLRRAYQESLGVLEERALFGSETPSPEAV